MKSTGSKIKNLKDIHSSIERIAYQIYESNSEEKDIFISPTKLSGRPRRAQPSDLLVPDFRVVGLSCSRHPLFPLFHPLSSLALSNQERGTWPLQRLTSRPPEKGQRAVSKQGEEGGA